MGFNQINAHGFEYWIFTGIFLLQNVCEMGEIYQQTGPLNMTSIPGNISLNVVHLKLYGTSITQLNSQDLSNFTSLRLFNMRSNKISYVAPDVFNNCACRTSLVTIGLRNNLLTNISFSNQLPVLRGLYVQENNLNKMPEFCCIFPELWKLDLEKNQITQARIND